MNNLCVLWIGVMALLILITWMLLINVSILLLILKLKLFLSMVIDFWYAIKPFRFPDKNTSRRWHSDSSGKRRRAAQKNSERTILLLIRSALLHSLSSCCSPPQIKKAHFFIYVKSNCSILCVFFLFVFSQALFPIIYLWPMEVSLIEGAFCHLDKSFVTGIK